MLCCAVLSVCMRSCVVHVSWVMIGFVLFVYVHIVGGDVARNWRVAVAACANALEVEASHGQGIPNKLPIDSALDDGGSDQFLLVERGSQRVPEKQW